jgi:hypothetical protein
MKCPDCGREMNHHAEKVDYSALMDSGETDKDFGGALEEFHTCPSCGKTHSQAPR